MWTKPTGSSSVSRKTGMREWPDFAEHQQQIADRVSMSTASMSARGTMTSSTRTSRSRRMLVSIARSSGVKALATFVIGKRFGKILADRAVRP